ncbi:hypothetical protein [Salidesulfovibrio onnuriiensis]|uniref:hypothetical protein n=1 Tax=Salidesulfovibrio onnuriiensis TaxID=2583823 RepID=UPI0011C9786B|nr:hypothetical protein [Salidesulfovibrio onnuriiensis]
MAENKAAPTRRKAVKIKPPGVRTRREPPRYDARAASERFVRAMTWITAIGLLFCAGQGLRWYTHKAQLDRIEQELQAQYVSVLGDDVGASPFGRMQFLHGQLTAQDSFGLDPLAVIAAFSRHSDFMVRIDKAHLWGESGTLEGLYAHDAQAFETFIQRLDTDEEYAFDLKSKEDALGGIRFRVGVGRR